MVTLVTLQGTKQRSGEDLMEYIKRFRDITLDCYDHYEEKTLVEMCIGNMIMKYRAVLCLLNPKCRRSWQYNSQSTKVKPQGAG